MDLIESDDISSFKDLRSRVCLKLGFPLDARGFNGLVLRAVQQKPYDLCWFDKPISIRKPTLQGLRNLAPEMLLVSYSPDDMTIPVNSSRHFRLALPFFDVHFTTKTHNVTPLKSMGARRVELVGNAYAPEVHRPMPRTSEDRSVSGAVWGLSGISRPIAPAKSTFLGANGIPVRVWGPNWRRYWQRPPAGVTLEPGGLFGDDYARAISNFDINLAFLRKVRGDRQTTRTMEIPACGAFMLAERTEEHLALFEEGREAEFFSDREELLRKCHYYLQHPRDRLRIAEAGRQRCLMSGYSNHDRMRSMLSIVREIQEKKRAERIGN